MAKLSKFGAAFKAAKSAGKSEFSFNGKSYNTKTKGDSAPKSTPAKKAAPTPTARPASATDGRKKLATQREVQKYGDAIREVVKAKAVKSSTTPIPAKSGTGTKAKPTAVPKAKAAIAAVAKAATTKERQPANDPSRIAYEKRKSIEAKKAAMGPPAPTMAQKAANKSTVGKSPIAVKNQANKKK